MFILIHKLAEDHLTFPDCLIHTFSSNMVATFYKMYYCVYSDIVKPKVVIIDERVFNFSQVVMT